MNEFRDPTDPATQATSIRASFARNLGLLAFVTFGSFIAVALSSAHTAVRHSSELAVASAEEQTRAELGRFFTPIETELGLLADWTEDGILSIDAPDSLNALLMPILRSQSAATSMLIATDDGREYMLLKTADGWLNRRIDRRSEPKASHWTRLSGSGEVLETYDRDLDYESRSRPWFQAAKDKPQQVVWTDPYLFFTTKDPGITAAMRVNTSSGFVIIALDLMLQDISTYTTSLQASTAGAVAVATSKGSVLGLPRDPRFATPAQRKSAILTSLTALDRPALAAALGDYKRTPNSIRRVIVGQDPWWITAKDAGLPNLDLIVMVAIPESSFKKPMELQNTLMFAIVLVALACAALLTWRANRRLNKLASLQSSRRVLGAFSLRDQLASDAEFEVFRADHDSLQRPMILKIFKGRLPNDIFETVQRLQAITDPHAGVPIEFGVTPDGTFFQADFDYGGVTLRELLTTGPLELNRALSIIRQICIALEDAHAHDVIHGNLRPSNIVIEQRGTNDTFVRVIDFTLKPGQMDAAENAGFVAPECIENPQLLSPASDVYSVGAILHQMLSPTPAYTGQTSTVILMKQLTEDPNSLNEQVPDFIKGLVLACLERRPEQRATLKQLMIGLSPQDFSVVFEPTVALRPPRITPQKRTPA